MMKLKLNGGKEVNLNLTVRAAMRYEKETGKHAFIQPILNVSTKSLGIEECVDIIYCAYKNGGNTPILDYDSFIDSLPNDFAEIMSTAMDLIAGSESDTSKN